MKRIGVVLLVVGLLGMLYFGHAVDKAKAEFEMFPMSIIPPKDKISPEVAKAMKSEKYVPVIVELTAPTTMSVEQQEFVLSEFRVLGFNITTQVFDVDNAMAGYIPSDKIELLAKNPYVKRILYDGYYFRVFSTNTTLPRSKILDADPSMVGYLKQIGVLGLPYTGKGVTVILIDSGIDEDHPWFKGLVVAKYEIAPTPKRGWTMPHGTHCAGIIHAVAPDAKFIDIVAIGCNGEARLSWILKALDLAYNLASKYHPCVCSCSWGGYPEDTPEMDAVRRAVARLEKVMPVVFAAGNFGPSPRTIACPADVDDVITVGAVDSSNHIAWFSSRGPDTYGNEHKEPDVVAPGVDIISARAGGGFVEMSGTSMACPFVTGIVALMLQKNPNLTNDECLKILEKTAKDLGLKGFDYAYGYGLVQADKALGMTSYEPVSIRTNNVGFSLSMLSFALGFGLILFGKEVEEYAR